MFTSKNIPDWGKVKPNMAKSSGGGKKSGTKKICKPPMPMNPKKGC